ncbi:Pre-mRNA-splicing factor cwf16 [Thecaphora frezii]
MSDRKALLHYYPPDFDPAKIPRRKIAKDRQQVVRLMAPFSMRCNTCGNYIYKGTKFNARKETVQGEDYYGIKIFRFYIKCTQCSAEITFKTDPKNTDYAAEHGASRNFEPWREDKEEGSEDKLAALEAAEVDPMKALEDKTIDSRREMEILDALQDIRTRNARLERVDADAVLQGLASKGKGRAVDGNDDDDQLAPEEIERRRAEEEDEALVRRYFSRANDIEIDEEREEAQRQVALEDEAERGSAEFATPRSSDTAQSRGPTAPRVVKRRIDDEGDDDDAEPDLTSLLSEKARAQLAATTAATTAAIPATVTGLTATVAATGGMQPAAKKKKKGPNAFGLVKKKAK